MSDYNFDIVERVIMFVDIHNYSLAARALEDRQYDFLQTIYEQIGDIVVEHQAQLIKYMGDGFLSVFESGLEAKAVACGLAMRKAFADLVRQWEVPEDTELEVGIGAGDVADGIFGHPSLQQRDIMGEPVFQAAVIGHHRGVALTESVAEKVKDQYPVYQLPDRKVKWQEEPLHVWAVEA